jgi:hypothetical protein
MSPVICKQEDRFAESAVGDETVIMDVKDGAFFTVRGPAVAIWRLIDGNRNRDERASLLHAQFDGSVDRIDRELDTFLSRLREAGFVA